MKRYFVIMTDHKGLGWGYTVLARDSKVAANKAVRRARIETKQDITLANVESVTYEGFYLARRFFAVE